MRKNKTKRLRLIGSYGITLLIALILLELSINFLLSHGSILMDIYKYPYLNPFREYYESIDRKIVTYLPECARYDKNLSYTLRPGKCRFKNREFDVEYRINSAGLRDDESSLISPEIIVLGDSHAMGWGVEQEQTFADLLEKKTDMKVLNAAIASYGTVRELKILKKLNTDNLKHLIIQYTKNDILENRAYYENGNVLPIMSREKYGKTVAAHLKRSEYFFGKHSIFMLNNLLNKFLSLFPDNAAASEMETRTEEVDLFMNALINSPVDLKGINIIVFEVNSYAGNDSFFIDRLNEVLSTSTYTHLKKHIVAVDLSPYLRQDKYFSLDEHMTAKGYSLIADKLIEIVPESGQK